MKKIFIAILSASAIFAGCQKIDSLLDTKNYSAYDTSNYPTTEKDADQLVAGLYHMMTGFYADPPTTLVFRNMLASDDLFGGGSTSNAAAQASDRFLECGQDESQTWWKQIYQGVFRTNFALESIPEIPDEKFASQKNKNYLLGQAYFFRGWYNWVLAEKHETFPLLTSTETVNKPRATVDEIYTQIKDDLLQAIELMPAEYGYSQSAGMSGRATKYAAEALLARVWMFYTGFYKKSDLFGVSKSDIVGYLNDVKNNSGFGLLDDPREIWPSSNTYSSGFAYGTDFNTYASRENIRWAGNRCKETIWACHFSLVWRNDGDEDEGTAFGWNRMGEYTGLRNADSAPHDNCYPYGIGYTNGTVNSKMVEEWHEDPDYGPSDKRLWGSVCAFDNAAEIYSWLDPSEVELATHPGNDKKEVEKTLFFNKKYVDVTCYSNAAKAELYENFFYAYNNACDNDHSTGNRNDVIYIRYADVLLMLDELNGTVDGMNALRKRAGLKPYDSYTLERLQKERRYEFAFEGERYTDMRRWFPDDAGERICNNQVGAWLKYEGKVTSYKDDPNRPMAVRYQKTHGFWPLAQTEINLSQGVLVQTPGFEEGENWLFSKKELPYGF